MGLVLPGHGGHQPRRRHPPRRVDVHRAERHPRHRDRAQHGPVRAGCARSGHARPRPLHRRPGAGRERAGWRGAGLRDQPDPARRRADPPRDAHREPGPPGAGHDGRAGPEPRDEGQPAEREAVGAELSRRLLRRAHPVPALRAVRGVAHRQTEGLPGRPARHRRGEGADPAGHAQHHPAGAAGARRARDDERPAAQRVVLRLDDPGPGGRPQRDPPGDGRPRCAQAGNADRGPVADAVAAAAPGGRAQEVGRVPRARGRGPVSQVASDTGSALDVDALGRWLDTQGLPVQVRLLSGGRQNEIFEVSRGEFRAAPRCASRPPRHRPSATPGSCASGGSSRRSPVPTCPSPTVSPPARTRA
ncbi:hypothetical protein FMEAI12_2770013 [Parafrankia sp. Ea1.12]|nr:hypothetical protein FMEAI12_2770013 [Parafrankia sp. Ea1.12]